MKHAIQFGKRTLSLTVSDDRVVGVLAPKPVKELKAVDAAVHKALRKPIGTAPLRDLLRGKKTALIATVDYTRPSPRRLLLPIRMNASSKAFRLRLSSPRAGIVR